MKKIYPLLLVTALLVSGCVITSLHPLYTEKDCVFEPALLGTWVPDEENSEESWTFEKGEETNYKLTVIEKRGTNFIDAHLIKLGTNLFLNFELGSEASDKLNLPEFSAVLLCPNYFFVKVFSIEPGLKFSALNQEWLEKLLKENPKAVRHEMIDDDRIILTASTKELQDFVLKYANDKEAFKESDEMMIKKPGNSQQSSDPQTKAK